MPDRPLNDLEMYQRMQQKPLGLTNEQMAARMQGVDPGELVGAVPTPPAPAPKPFGPGPRPQPQPPLRVGATAPDLMGTLNQIRSEPKPKGFVDDMRENWPEYTGGTVGGIIGGAKGAVLGAPFGPGGMITGGIIGGVTGAAGGGASGKGYQLMAQGKLGSETATQEMLDAAANQGVSEFFGQPLGLLGGTVAAGGFARGSMIPGLNRLNKILDRAARNIHGTDLSPVLEQKARTKGAFIPLSQGSQARWVKKGENFVRGSYLGDKGLFENKTINPIAYRQALDDTAKDFWDQTGQRLTPEQTAQLFRDTVTGKQDAWHKEFSEAFKTGLKVVPDEQLPGAVAQTLDATRKAWRTEGSKLYQDVDAVLQAKGQPVTITREVPSKTPGPDGKPQMTTQTEQSWKIVDMDPLRDLGKRLIEMAAPGGNSGSASGIRALGQDLLKRDKNMTFWEADAARSYALEELRQVDLPLGNRSDKVAKAMIDVEQTIDKAMEDAVAKQGIPEVTELLKNARQKWAIESALDRQPVVQSMARSAKAGSGNLIRQIFKPNSSEQIKMARRAIGDDLFYQLRDTWLAQTVEDALKNKSSIGGALRAKLDKMKMSTLEAMYSTDEIANLYKMADFYANQGAQQYENRVIRSALQNAIDRPGDLMPTLFQKGDTELVKKYKSILGPNSFEKVRAAWVEDVLRRGGPKPGIHLQGILDDLGDDVLKEIFPGNQLRNIRDVARLGQVLDSTSVDASNILAPLVEAGALTTLVAAPFAGDRKSDVVGTSALILAFPMVMGRILSNRKTAYWLAQGVRHPEKMKMYGQRIGAELVRYGARPDLTVPELDMPQTKKPENLYLSMPKM